MTLEETTPLPTSDVSHSLALRTLGIIRDKVQAASAALPREGVLRRPPGGPQWLHTIDDIQLVLMVQRFHPSFGLPPEDIIASSTKH